MRYFIFLVLVGLSLGCSRRPVMNSDAYARIHPGMHIEEVKALAGQPYRFGPSEEGEGEDYVYVERQQIASKDVEFVHYILQVDEEGVVFDKKRRVYEDEFEFEWKLGSD